MGINPPSNPDEEFVAVAKGNIDDDDFLDIWAISHCSEKGKTSDRFLFKIQDDCEDKKYNEEVEKLNGLLSEYRSKKRGANK
ncbi:MAG: hypothetical protein V1872_11290 [bacterium]